MINLLKHKPFFELLAACEPGQRHVSSSVKRIARASTLPVPLCRKHNGKKLYSVENSDEEAPNKHEIRSLADREKLGKANIYLFNMAMVS